MISKRDTQKVKSTLHKVYQKFSSRGVLAIYLWGSSTNDEYVAWFSDIDCLAIVDKKATEKDERQAKLLIKQLAPKKI